MRLATFERADGVSTIGLVLPDESLLDINREISALDAAGGELDMLALIADFKDYAPILSDMKTAPRTKPEAPGSVRLKAPIPRPRKNVFCVGWNYVDHFNEGSARRQNEIELPKNPTFFSKAPTSVIGPYDDIVIPGERSRQIDWEAELGLVIGRAGKNIPESEALAHVFGYVALNDITARDIQRRHGGQWFKGKSIDCTCPVGPWIVTCDEISFDSLGITCRVNGEVKQSSNTSSMYFQVPRIISELSEGLTLEAGDMIATGTPSGVGSARDPQQFLADGDVVETDIAGIGILRNVIRAH